MASRGRQKYRDLLLRHLTFSSILHLVCARISGLSFTLAKIPLLIGLIAVVPVILRHSIENPMIQVGMNLARRCSGPAQGTRIKSGVANLKSSPSWNPFRPAKIQRDELAQ